MSVEADKRLCKTWRIFCIRKPEKFENNRRSNVPDEVFNVTIPKNSSYRQERVYNLSKLLETKHRTVSEKIPLQIGTDNVDTQLADSTCLSSHEDLEEELATERKNSTNKQGM